MLEGYQDNCYEEVGKEEQPQLQDHDLFLLLLRVLNHLWLHTCFNLELKSHVQVEEHESNRDEKRERAAGLVGD